MKKRTALLIFLVLLFLGAMSVFWLKLGFDNIALREGVFLLTPLVATIAGFFALRAYGLKNDRSITILCLTAGITYWFIGEILFEYFEYILKIDPYPSAADIFYILAYPLLLSGLVNEIRLAHVNWKKLDKLNLLVFILLAFVFVLLVCYMGIYNVYDGTAPFLTNFVGISYGVGDLLLILASGLLLLLAWEFRGGKLSRVWMTLCMSFIMFFVADLLYLVYNDQYDTWFYKSLFYTFWIAAYILFAYALFDFGFSIQDAYHKLLKQSHNKFEKHEEHARLK